jgi:hypothetical protein|tara:strand:+ start:1786 stop:2031 length:246 start_codon:yes stop_codon:yes gene_type:complete
MCKQINNKKLLQDVHTKNQTVREKVELQEAVALVEQTLAEYVENSLSDVIHELEYREDIRAISSAWELIKTKVEESKNANA